MLLALVIMSRSCSLGISWPAIFFLSFSSLLFSPSLARSSYRAHLFALTDKFLCISCVLCIVDLLQPLTFPCLSFSLDSDHQSCSTFCIFKRPTSRSSDASKTNNAIVYIFHCHTQIFRFLAQFFVLADFVEKFKI